MANGPASPGRARPPVDPPPPRPVPPQLWLLRNRRTGEWIKSHQESYTAHKEIIVSCMSIEAAEAAVRFYRMFAGMDPEPIPITIR